MTTGGGYDLVNLVLETPNSIRDHKNLIGLLILYVLSNNVTLQMSRDGRFYGIYMSRLQVYAKISDNLSDLVPDVVILETLSKQVKGSS